MTTLTLERTITDEELQALFENEPPCLYSRGDYESGRISMKCEKPATWAAVCRKCGFVTMLCDHHYAFLTPADLDVKLWCTECRAVTYKFSVLYMCVRKI